MCHTWRPRSDGRQTLAGSLKISCQPRPFPRSDNNLPANRLLSRDCPHRPLNSVRARLCLRILRGRARIWMGYLQKDRPGRCSAK